MRVNVFKVFVFSFFPLHGAPSAELTVVFWLPLVGASFDALGARSLGLSAAFGIMF